MTSKDELTAALRNDLHAFAEWAFYQLNPGQVFVTGWHIEAILYQLQQAQKGPAGRLIVNMPPRYLKSFLISVVFPAWLLGKDPATQIMAVSYSDDLARKHSRDCRRLMESPGYKALFPKCRISPAKNSETEFETTAGGFRLSVSMQGSITGRGCDVMILDDPSKADDMRSDNQRQHAKDIFDNTLYSRLNDKMSGVIILVMQRLHEDDLTQYLLDKSGFTHLCLPAIALEDQSIPLSSTRFHHRKAGDVLCPAREDAQILQQIKASMNSIEFEAQYQQRPVTFSGAIFKRDAFRFVDELPAPNKYDRTICSWDLANKPGQSSDYSVGTVWGIKSKDYYLLDVIRVRLAYPELKQLVKTIAEKHSARTILIEDIGAGTSMIQDLDRTSHTCAVIGIKPKQDKETRALCQTDLLEAGRVYLPKNASWLEDYLHELTAFPRGRKDDQVDSTTQFLQWARESYYEIPIVSPYWLTDNRHNPRRYP